MARVQEVRLNPFRDAIVANPWDGARVDVPSIHGDVFDECLRGIEHVRQSGGSAGLLIHGEAGSGKTHLLSRLRGELTPRAPSATGRDECLYVYVRLQTSPRMIWRTLRRTLVEDWFRPVVNGRTQFERILFHRLAEIRVAEGDLERWYEYMLDEVPSGLEELLERIAVSLHLDRNTAIAFKHIAFGRHLRDLRAWLAGTSLPEAALERMDLALEEGGDDEREDQARQIVIKLCQLAGNGLPVVLSFDQVEALEMHPGDSEALFSFGQLISTLHAETTNALLVSCVQSAFATRLKDSSRGADYDRITSLGALSLDPLDRAQAEQLIRARLAAAADRTSENVIPGGSWPLEPREFQELFAAGRSVTPRKLLSLCAERFETRARPAPGPDRESLGPEPRPQPDSRARSVPAFLEDRWETALERTLAANAPSQTEEIVRHGLPLVVQIVAPETTLVRDEQLRDVSLVFETSGKKSGVSICTQSNMTSLAARLKRLKTQFATGRVDRLTIVRDSRVPITPSAKAAKQYLGELEAQGARVIFPAQEALAALDALRGLLSDAKSGDLACDGQAVSPQTVEEWLTAHLAESLRTLVDEVFAADAGDGPGHTPELQVIEDLNELLAERPMLPLAEASQTLGRSVEELAGIASRHPAHFRVLGPHPLTLFRAEHTGGEVAERM